MKYNALKHGLFTKETLLPFENRRDYLRFRRNTIASLNPQNDLESHLANDIADDAWRVRRHDNQIYAQRQKLYSKLTPQMVAAVGQVPEELHAHAPQWFTDMQTKIEKGQQQFAYQVCQEYEECQKNFASIPNLGAVAHQFVKLFTAADERAKLIGQPAVINIVTHKVDGVWQSHTKELWLLLEQVYQYAYFQAHWKEIRAIALPWVESWYFIAESESSRMEHLKSLGIKVRADFRRQLQAYERLKKNAITFSPVLNKLAGGNSQEIYKEGAVQDEGKTISKAKSHDKNKESAIEKGQSTKRVQTGQGSSATHEQLA